MNKQRRQQFNELAEKIRALKDEVETLRDEEQDYYDNMPESFQNGEKGDKTQEAIDALDEALDSLDSAADSLDTGGYIYDDGGRAAAGFKGTTGDCVTRAIAIATGKPYKEVYDALNELAKRERTGKRKRKISSSRTGVYRSTYGKYLQTLGWEWVPTMKIGQGCRVHLNAAELPSGTIMVKVTHHLTTMIDGVIHDIYDPRRIAPNNATEGELSERCVYGYYHKKEVKG